MSDVDDPVSHDFDIMIMNADGSNPVNLTRNIVGDSDLSFSPDGGTVVFIWSTVSCFPTRSITIA